MHTKCNYGTNIATLHHDVTFRNMLYETSLIETVTMCSVIIKPLYQDKLTTDKNLTVVYSIRDEISTTCIQLCEWCKINVFTSNIMVLHHKMSQTVKIKVNTHTNIYLLMKLFSINHFIFIFSCISVFLSFIQ